MSQPYVGEIRTVGFNFAPNGWAFCDGSLLSIADNEVLFTLIGTTYGGDGQSTFALPDLRGRVPVGQGGSYVQGEVFGSETVPLSSSHLPPHSHPIQYSTLQANQVQAANGYPAMSARQTYADLDGSTLAADSLGVSGSGLGHENRQPLLCVNFVISLFGVFPSQN